MTSPRSFARRLGVNDPVGRWRGIGTFVSRCDCGATCLKWVNRYRNGVSARRPLFPRLRRNCGQCWRSGSCQNRKSHTQDRSAPSLLELPKLRMDAGPSAANGMATKLLLPLTDRQQSRRSTFRSRPKPCRSGQCWLWRGLARIDIGGVIYSIGRPWWLSDGPVRQSQPL
jgi:hypothetical protein